VKLDIKGVLAILVVVGSFGLLAPYAYTLRPPDHELLLFVGGALMLVLGFFFGHVNGAQTALANSAVQLAQQAIEKRTSAPQGSTTVAAG